ncbi:MAG: hypothetical protein EOP35_26035 [Rubrivivax sp.]|nr:MAG: hypothetical protein EOP35_26035 [Rubrivivax sp.]
MRAGQLQLAVRHPDLTPRPVRFELRQAEGAETLARHWPDDFSIRETGDGYEGRLSLGEARTFSPLRDVTAFDAAGEPYERVDSYALRLLFGTTVGEINRCFIKTHWRTPDDESLTFACQQVRDFYRADAGQRNMVSVIFGYRALDFADTDLLEEAAEWLTAEIAAGNDRPHDNHKMDGVHQRISMGMALWMVRLSLGDNPGTVRALDETIAYLRGIAQPHGLHALNGCRMMMLRAYLHQVAGEQAAGLELARLAFDFFRQCAAVAEPDPATFGEMSQGHHAAWIGLKLIQHVNKKRPLYPARKVFDAAHRVKSPSGVARLNERYTELLAWIARPGAA